MFLSVIELGLARNAAPVVSDLLTTWGLIKAIGMSSHDKLIVDLEAVAHHAGYRWRIHWDQAHCARGVGTQCPIGPNVTQLPIGQGVGMFPIWEGFD